MYGARKFTWERRDEYGVYRDECGHARGVAGEMIPVTKDDIRKLLERASLFEESHICLPEHATSFTLTRLAPELYTKDEINEMVFGICGAQEKLGEELKSLVEDTHQPLDRGYNELFRTSIDAPHAPSIDVILPTAQIPAEPQCSAKHKDEWEVSYIDTRINDVYYPLNNNVDWLSTKIELLQQDLDTIRKKDQQPATLIDVCNITSLDAKVSAMNERLRTYEDMHDRFISPAKSSSIDRLQGPWIDGKNPVELLPYTAAEVDEITSKIYTAIDTMEERLDKRCDDIYFPFDNRISGLDSHVEWLQKEVKAIQRQLAAQHQISASIDRKRAQSLDGKSPRSTDEHIIASIDADSTPAGEQLIHKTIESMHKELTELLAYAYENIGWHKVSIDNVQDRLQNISNVLEKMDDKWTRNDEATRSFIASWSRIGYNELFRSMVEMRTEIESLRQQLEKEATTSESIDAPHAPSIDVNLPTAQIPAKPQCSAKHKDEWLRGPWIDGKNPMELLPYTSAEVDKITSKIYTIDAESTPAGEQLIHKTIESMHKEMTELSAHAYDNIGWHQVSIDNIQDRLQNISNVLEKMDDKWTRNDEATRNSIIDAKADQPLNYTLALTIIYHIFSLDVYCPLNNNVDWLSTKIELLQQDLDTIRKKDQQPATSIDMCTFTSLDAKVSAMNERLRTYEDMHDRFISPVMIDLNKLSSQLLHAQKDIENITNQSFLQAKSASINRLRGPWIDGKKHVVEKITSKITAAEVEKITSKIYTALDTMEERLHKRCDDIYFPFDNKISGLDSHEEWLQKEVKAIQRQLAAQHQISASIDRTRAKSIDGNSPRSTNEHLIASIDAESIAIGEQLIHKTIESMQKELTELSAYAYDNIGWHQVSIDNVQKRLQNISNVLEKMDDKWTRNDEATRSFIASCTIFDLVIADNTKDAKADQPINYTLALNRMKQVWKAKSASIDRLRGPWIDGKKPVELLPYTAAEVDKITSKIYTAIDTMEERLDKRCDDIYFPFDNKISGLDRHAEWLQKEVKAIQRQLAAQHQISASIDRTGEKSIDGNSPR
ncbi:hypothetical protein F2Q68_00033473 [Brassica cretica]|uniref:Uncharacterized protein n=1 Tax=Brassica cretica TaxID=69181 RepID=A0A8S9H401_BRACR|nr:hypothetical protein F2Q68_00033473 [Brassica cretica]